MRINEINEKGPNNIPMENIEVSIFVGETTSYLNINENDKPDDILRKKMKRNTFTDKIYNISYTFPASRLSFSDQIDLKQDLYPPCSVELHDVIWIYNEVDISDICFFNDMGNKKKFI